jgi:predicted restriction endonuclease
MIISYPSSLDADSYLADFIDDNYIPNDYDEREKIFRSIAARRGQKKFRDTVREMYGDKCLITGCGILDILEAAHIAPFKGEKDNHFSNGLLLRADIHTLFDLDLIGIEPNDMKVHINQTIKKDGYEHLENKPLLLHSGNRKPSKDALILRWNKFKNSNLLNY